MDPFILLLGVSFAMISVIYATMKLAEHFHIDDRAPLHEHPVDRKKVLRDVALPELNPKHLEKYE